MTGSCKWEHAEIAAHSLCHVYMFACWKFHVTQFHMIATAQSTSTAALSRATSNACVAALALLVSSM